MISSLTAQNNPRNQKAITLLDSVKSVYGDTCNVGVSSKLIRQLFKYKNNSEVKSYLKTYNKLHQQINEFRRHYIHNIKNDKAMLLGLYRIFKGKANNIVNACGIYFGPDSVTNIALSYTIVRSSVSSFYLDVVQLLNFDKTFKSELKKYGKDWFYSEKLRQIKNSPVK